MNEKEIIRLYTEEKYTLRRIASIFDTNHHMIKRILVANDIEITNDDRNRKPFTDEHRRKIGLASKGRRAPNKGKKMNEEQRRQNMMAKLDGDYDLTKYPDYDRLLFLSRIYTKRRNQFENADVSRNDFWDCFYFDKQFNAIYDAWIINNKNKWYRPTLDHMIALSNGGQWQLYNLQFLSWFENRAKESMSEQQWQDFCIKTKTKSELFIRD